MTGTTLQEIIERLLAGLVSATADHLTDDLWTEDAVVEMPFAPTGSQRRCEGRDAFFALARAGQAALPVRFTGARNVVVHETNDPAVVIAEYELAGTITTTGQHASAAFIGVLTVRDGRIAGWREYQDSLAISHLLGAHP